MATDSEALDILEAKIQELENKLYGEKLGMTENFNPVIDSLLQANTLMTSAISLREKFAVIFKRMHELQDYLELNPLSEDLTGINAKLHIIMSMKDEYENNKELLKKVNDLKHVLDDNNIKNTQLLREDLNNLVFNQLKNQEILNEVNENVGQLLTQFNEVCLELSKSFFFLNEIITDFEKESENKK